MSIFGSETSDSIKQNAALCLLRLLRVAPDHVGDLDWTSRAIHLLNDPHLVCLWFSKSGPINTNFHKILSRLGGCHIRRKSD